MQHAAGSPCRCLHAEGGWYAILEVPRIRTEEEWALHLLAESDVLVQPGFFYDFEAEAFLVLSLLTPPRDFRRGAPPHSGFGGPPILKKPPQTVVINDGGY